MATEGSKSGGVSLKCIMPALLLCAVVTLNPELSNAEGKMAFTLESSAFTDGEKIPRKYTCEGRDISPPLQWSGLPEGTRSLVLIVDDPDARDPEAPKMTYVHWVLYNLPIQTAQLPEAVASEDLPDGTGEGLNDWKRTGYGGPCPPIGRHRYFHKLYALDTVLSDLPDSPTKDDVEAAMDGHVIGKTQIVGTYQKGD